MYYEPGRTGHGLPFDPFKSCVVPRPIWWISTLGPDGVANLAPFSQFQNITYNPPIVMFAANQTTDGRRKDTTRNAEAEGAFVWNMATYDLREAVNLSAQELPASVDEFEIAGLTKAPSRLVRPPRVAESPIHFECIYMHTLRLPGEGVMGTVDVVFGRVAAIHIADWALTPEGRIDVACLKPLARLGYYEYTFVERVFSMEIPGPAAINEGLEGAMAKDRARRGA